VDVLAFDVSTSRSRGCEIPADASGSRSLVEPSTRHRASRPALRKAGPEDPVDSSELRPLGAVTQEGELLPKRQILQRQMAARSQGGVD